MTPCVRGCTVQHPHGPACLTDCAILVPVDAEHGLICNRCHRGLTDALGAREGLGDPGRESHGLPWVWDRLWGALVPSAGSTDGRGMGDPGSPLNLTAHDLIADIRDVLGSWCAEVKERHGMAGPPDVYVFTDRRPFPRDGRVVVRRCSAWLLRQVALLEVNPGVGEAVSELEDLMRRGHALVPWRPAPTVVPGVPCRCASVGSIHDYGTERRCWRCGRSWTDEEWRIWTVVLARRFDGSNRIAT